MVFFEENVVACTLSDEKGKLIMNDEAIQKAVDATRTFLQNEANDAPTSIVNCSSSIITRIIAMRLKKEEKKDSN